jgi:hypothetical protein
MPISVSTIPSQVTQFTAAEAITAVEGEATLVLSGDVTIAAGKALSVDTISEITAGSGVTADGLNIKDGNAVPGAGKGIDFAAQASPAGGMTSELLDRYEEGTWTPAFADASLDGSGEGQAYSVQLGHYTRIGRVVYIDFSCTISNLGTMVTSQNVNVVGLPFPSKNVGQYSATVSVSQMDSAAITAGVSPVGAITSNASHMQMFQFSLTTGVAILTVAQLSTGGSIRASGFYIV